MIKSMTGFAAAEETEGQLFVGIEIRSYNSRQLDIALRISSGYGVLEEDIKRLVSKELSRGRVEISVRIKDESEAATRFEVDMPKARAYYQALCRIRDALGLHDPPLMEHIMRAGDVVFPAELDDLDAKNTWPAMERCLKKALNSLNRMREKEGNFITRDFRQRLDEINTCLKKIEEKTDGLLAVYQGRLQERIHLLTRGMIEIDPSRIAQEAAFLADKSDISEEITRAGSHIVQFNAEMDSEEPAGRKLNFLLQEFNREFNTMGSKVGNSDISYLIVHVKTELEKIREQVQNVE